MRRPSFVIWTVPLALAAALAGFAVARAGADGGIEFGDVRRQTLEFHRYNKNIVLTAEQQAVFEKALAALPAPCCSDRSALTCCCTCNQARAWWGLAKHLIADRGLDAAQVRREVKEWFEFTNPRPAGDACYRGRCGRPFHQDGCGGMQEGEVVF